MTFSWKHSDSEGLSRICFLYLGSGIVAGIEPFHSEKNERLENCKKRGKTNLLYKSSQRVGVLKVEGVTSAQTIQNLNMTSLT